MAERSEAKIEKKLLVKLLQINIFGAKLRSAHFALLRSAIFSEIKVDSLLIILFKNYL